MFANRHVLAVGGGEFVLLVAQDVVHPNVHQMALAAGWNGQSPLRVRFECANVNRLEFKADQHFPGGVSVEISPATRIGGSRIASTSGLEWAIFVHGGFASELSIDNRGIISAAGGSGLPGSSATATDTAGHSVTASGGAGGEGQGYRPGTTIIEGPDPGRPGQTACTPGGAWSNPRCATGSSGSPGYEWGKSLYGQTTAVSGGNKITWLHVGQILGRRG
ncbi:MAG: hypothetical protein Q4A97_08480 [Comamonadaceae bacterium]|nr:hypothetical protein [Comamonadaceae bacterium]